MPWKGERMSSHLHGPKILKLIRICYFLKIFLTYYLPKNLIYGRSYMHILASIIQFDFDLLITIDL